MQFQAWRFIFGTNGKLGHVPYSFLFKTFCYFFSKIYQFPFASSIPFLQVHQFEFQQTPILIHSQSKNYLNIRCLDDASLFVMTQRFTSVEGFSIYSHLNFIILIYLCCYFFLKFIYIFMYTERDVIFPPI